MSSELSKNILTTLAYYDVMDYPMTSFEVWKHLFRSSDGRERDAAGKEPPLSLLDVINELESDSLGRFIEQHQGFFFLRGRKNIIEQRIRRNKISERKYRRTIRVAKILRAVPFVRMIAVTGRMAMKNADEKSDLDLLIVLRPGKIFTGRFLVTLAVHLIGKRRYREKITDRVCLNYFVTSESLEIGLKDMFSSSEYCFMLPIFGLETFKEFRRRNEWIREYKSNYVKFGGSNMKAIPDTFLARTSRNLGETLLGASFIERLLKSWQMKRISRNPKTNQTGSLVIANDQELVFLPSPQGPRVYERFKERIASLV